MTEIPPSTISSIKVQDKTFTKIHNLNLPYHLNFPLIAGSEIVFGLSRKFRGKFNNPEAYINDLIRASKVIDMRPKVVIITGANSGIGLVTAKNLYRAGHHIILACRSESKAMNAINEIESIQALGKVQFIPLDLSSLNSVKKFCTEFKNLGLQLDILINNAGIMWVPHELTKDNVESQMGVNFLSHFYLTDLLLDTMHKGSKIINLSSLASFFVNDIDIDQIKNPKVYNNGKNYSQSKLAMLLFSNYLNKTLSDRGIIVYCVNPGLVQTNLYTNSTLAKLISKLGKFYMKDEISGTFTTLRCALLPPQKDHGQPNVYYSDENLFTPPKASGAEGSIYLLIDWANSTLKDLEFDVNYLKYKF